MKDIIVLTFVKIFFSKISDPSETPSLDKSSGSITENTCPLTLLTAHWFHA